MITAQNAFGRQTRVLLWGGFGGLLLLMAILGVSALSFTSQIEIRQEQIRKDYVERDRALEGIRSAIFISGTYIRDYLLDDGEPMAAMHKAAFLEARSQVESGIKHYEGFVRPDERSVFGQFTKEWRAYADSISPALGWTAEQRKSHGNSFIEKEVLPRRMLTVDLTDRIHELSERRLNSSSQEVTDIFASFRNRLAWLLAVTLGIGLLLAGFTLWRILGLERETEIRFQQILTARTELKRLSAELVSAQESERLRISRELHDEVGQVLSAIMLGLGSLRAGIERNDTEEALHQLQLVQDMTERNAAVVRNISLLLRPAMLDDLGLLPALKWLAREVARTCAIQVDVVAEGNLDGVPEDHRTCIYRVVQEAVHNASRHSGARQIRIRLHELSEAPAKDRRLQVSVQDDGKGFDPSLETGIGILGMEERIAHLGGVISLDSEPGRGSIISFELPVPDDAAADQATSPLRTAYRINSGRL